MRIHHFTRTIAALAILATATIAAHGDAAADYRQFTDTQGRTLTAMVLGKAEDSVTLRIKGRNEPVTIPLAKLSEADQKFLADWKMPKGVFLESCRSLTVRELLELRGYESLKFEFVNNSIIVPGELNGHKARFLIDTGAHNTILHEPFAVAADCKVGEMDQWVYGVAGRAPAGWAEVDTIKLGETVIKNRKLLATDLSNGLPEGSKVKEDAIFGAEFLAKLDAVISYRERLMFLRPDLADGAEVKDADAGNKEEKLAFRLFKLKDGTTIRGQVNEKTATGVKIRTTDGTERGFTIDRFQPDDALFIRRWSKDAVAFEQNCRNLTVQDLLTLRGYQAFETERRGNHIYVDGTLNGNKVNYMVDTGADGTTLHVHHAKKNKCDVGPMDQWVYGIGGRAPAAVTQIQKLTIGDAVLTGRQVLSCDLAHQQDDDALDHVGIFGADYMRELNAVITYREMRLFLRQSPY